MNRTRILGLSFAIALAGVGSAFAQEETLPAGTYKLAVGSDAPCTIAVADDGHLSQAATCSIGTTLTKCKKSGGSYQLLSGSGEIYAVLRMNDDKLVGKTFHDRRDVVFSK